MLDSWNNQVASPPFNLLKNNQTVYIEINTMSIDIDLIEYFVGVLGFPRRFLLKTPCTRQS
jgi:hypothetical protein